MSSHQLRMFLCKLFLYEGCSNNGISVVFFIFNIRWAQVIAAKRYSQISFSAEGVGPLTTSVRDVIRRCYSHAIRAVTHGKEVLLSICPAPCYVWVLSSVRNTMVHLEEFIIWMKPGCKFIWCFFFWSQMFDLSFLLLFFFGTQLHMVGLSTRHQGLGFSNMGENNAIAVHVSLRRNKSSSSST